MRILSIAPQPFFTPRGTPLSVYYRALTYTQLGHQVDILTYGQGADVEMTGLRVFRIPAFRWLGDVPVGPSWLKLFLDLVLLTRLVGRLLRQRYDMVNAHEEAVFLCILLKPFFRFKLVYDMHSSLPRQLTTFRFTSFRPFIGAFEMLERKSLMMSDAVITVSPRLADHAAQIMPNKRRLFMIENSLVDEIRLKNDADAQGLLHEWLDRLPRDRPIVLYAGTLEPYQGIELLIRAFERTRQRLPQAFLLLVGGSPAQVRFYRDLVSSLGLEDHSIFAGPLPRSVTRALMDLARVLTSPRKIGNNTPLKVYELLASGKPVVATRVVSHTQVLTEDVCYLAEPVVDDFSEKLFLALTDVQANEHKATAARELFETRYSRQRFQERVRAVIETVKRDTDAERDPARQ